MRNRFGLRYGWVAYAGELGDGPQTGLAIGGDVIDVTLDVQQGYMDVGDISMMAPFRVTSGPPEVTMTVRMAEATVIRGKPQNVALWDILAHWPKPGRREWPPSLRAMAELARRHPEEYAMLREAEEAREALRVVRHDWAGG